MSSPGQPAVVWVEREGRLEPLRVLSGDAGTLTVQDPAGREERLARRRVVFSSAASRSQVAGSRELAAHRVAVDAALSSAAPAEVWELMLEEGLQEVPAAELAELLFGDAGPVSLDALQVFLAPSPPWFRSGREGRVRIQ
ncbi:MAG: hypothetical protein FJ098_09040, partial [Deltaproteobacteria bacterium]|nr:hypothetical protein [Deltaproteobacteria bacterium]